MLKKNYRIFLFDTGQDRERIKVCVGNFETIYSYFKALSITSTRVVLDLRVRDLPRRRASGNQIK